jgi:hypothetical protein
MRTTLDVDDGVLAAARALSAEHGISLGDAISELARRGLAHRAPVELDGLPAFDVSADAAAITPEMVREANEEQGLS